MDDSYGRTDCDPAVYVVETNDDSSGNNDCDPSQYVFINDEDIPKYIEERGVSGIEKIFKAKLEDWKNVEVQIGVTGNSGVGKSSFINAIRGLYDDDEGAANTGVNETTMEAAVYPHPTNKQIKFWDLPGIGTPNYPDLETYCEKVNLKRYDTFLILTASRFTQNDLLLAKTVTDMKKSFLFVRTKIDVDVQGEKRKRAFKEDVTLSDIRKKSLENLKDLIANDENVFLISSHKPNKWDFARLTEAILDGLPLRQRETLTLSLDLLTTQSKDILKRKADVLRGRIWMVAAASFTGALIPLPGVSITVDAILLRKEINLYQSQLIGLSNEKSDEFQKITPELRQKLQKFWDEGAERIPQLIAAYGASSAVEETVRYIPMLGIAIAGSISFSSTYCFLQRYLNELERTGLEFIDEVNTRAVEDMPLD